jgi:CRP/FNR family transcriptional regulator
MPEFSPDPHAEPAGENKVWYLKRSKLFERAGDDVVRNCEHLFTQVRYAKRTVVFEQGDAARLVYFVKRGKIRIARRTPDGKEITIAILGPGDLFGEEVVFSETVRTTVATCLNESTLCMARSEDLYGLMTRHPVLCFNVAKYLHEQRDDALSAAEDVAYLKVPERILKLLERLAVEYGSPVRNMTRIDVRLTHADIASLIGSTRETVSVQLGELVRDGRIALEGRSFLLPQKASAGAKVPALDHA